MAFLPLLLCLSVNLFAQQDSSRPLSAIVFKKPVPANPFLSSKVTYTYKKPSGELMSWPNYPLTAAQIAARDKEDEANSKPVPYLVNQVVNTLLNGKKQHRPAQVPRF